MKSIIPILFFIAFLHNANAQVLKDSTSILQMQAPDTFKAKFKTTQGDFIIEVYKSWSPKAADRLYQLITSGYYNNIVVYRATAKYVQFGISDQKAINSFWEGHAIADEPVLDSNKEGNISFASAGPNTRTAQIFINMQNNLRLDTIHFMGGFGFPPVGKVIEGMDVVKKFNKQYGDDIAYNYQDSIYNSGNRYLIKNFPGLDVILSASIVDKQ
ncbi:hypothetical protein BH11BAC6_BH11BAC6_08990 [soil metagenome]